MTYQEFLEQKIDIAPLSGLEVSEQELSPALKPHQRDSVLWALRGGRRALFAAFYQSSLETGVLDAVFCRRQLEKYEASRAEGRNAYAGWD